MASLNTTVSTFNLLASPTTINAFAGASVALNIGNAAAAAAFPGGITIPTGKTLAGAGAIDISGKIGTTVTSGSDACFEAINTSATGFGAYIKGGATTQYSLRVLNQSGSTVFDVLGNGAVTIPGTLGVTGNATAGCAAGSTWSSGKAFEVGFLGCGLWAVGQSDNSFLTNLYYNSGYLFAGTGYAMQYLQYAGEHRWLTSSASGTAGNAATLNYVMTISATGAVTIPGTLGVSGASAGNGNRMVVNCNAGNLSTGGVEFYDPATGSTAYYINKFYRNTALVGSIQTTNVATNYVTSSDRRLKIDRGLSIDTTVLLNTRVHDFDWESGGSHDCGVFAQEAQFIKPTAVFIGSDEKTDAGELKNPWAVDYSKYVPNLIVGWQNHEARLCAIESRQ